MAHIMDLSDKAKQMLSEIETILHKYGYGDMLLGKEQTKDGFKIGVVLFEKCPELYNYVH